MIDKNTYVDVHFLKLSYIYIKIYSYMIPRQEILSNLKYRGRYYISIDQKIKCIKYT